jgi:hypothetical protein
MIKNNYLEKLFQNFPVLFVNDFSDISYDMLIQNDHLYYEALSFDMRKLDLNHLFQQAVEKSLTHINNN